MTALTTSGLARPIPVEPPAERGDAPPDRATLTGPLRPAEQTCPHRPAVTDHTRAITYAEPGAAARRAATGLRRAGIGPGHRVAVLGPRDAVRLPGRRAPRHRRIQPTSSSWGTYGHPTELCDTRTFEAAPDRPEGRHPEAVRPAASRDRLTDRNVRTDSDRLGVRFAPPACQWWDSALARATGTGLLPPLPSGR
ncbi:AMP-binding protein [Streptomyces sp. NPDC008125]|uniref:AMP-binding protein n=1 Tax=Streptomyces sp. NPDC008125 TaxID=3364811 RepID=UPI0036EB08CB